ncbi:MAG: hypothetical protein EOO54_08655, partial [Haliea sp.]
MNHPASSRKHRASAPRPARLHPLALACLLACAAPGAFAVPCAAANDAAVQTCLGTAGVTQINLVGAMTLTSAINLASGITLNTNGFDVTFNSLQGGGTLDTGAAGGKVTIKSSGMGLQSFVGQSTVRIDSGSIATPYIFYGANSHGATEIAANSLLILAGNATLGTGPVTNAGRLYFGPAAPYSLANDFSGSGLWMLESGSTVYTGTAHQAAIEIYSGATLQVGNGGTTGFVSSMDPIFTQGSLVFNRSDTVTIGSEITGPSNGLVTHAGSGTLIFTGNNSYFAPTLITGGGTLQVGNGGTTGTLGNRAVTVGAGATLAFNRSDATFVANNIGGPGAVRQDGAGTLRLTGSNTFAGGLAINGGTVSAGASVVLGTGGINLNGGQLTGTGSMTLNQPIAVTPATTGTMVTAAGTTLRIDSPVTLGAGSTLRLGDAGNNGVVEFGGTSFTVAGDAQLVVAGGTARVLQSSGLTARTTIDAGATLDFNMLIASIGTLQGAGSLRGDGNTVYVSEGAFSGDAGGSMRLVKQGGGTLVLTGANTHTGGTTVFFGTLQVGDGGTNGTLGAGPVTNSHTLVFNRSDEATIANAISGAGTLTQAGSGNLILTGANAYTGATTISPGTLQVGNGGTTGTLGTGAVTNNGTLAFNRSDSVTIANAISGTGNLTQSGNGTTILTGANTYGGTTTISAGTLQFGDGGGTDTIGNGNIVNNANLVFNHIGVLGVIPDISGTGGLTLAGGGLILSGNNTYSGTTTITSGTLQIDTGGTSGTLGTGNVVNNSSLEFARGDAITVGNAISGTGRIELLQGDVTLTGNNTYAGLTGINGILRLGNGGTAGTLGTGDVANGGELVFNRSDTVTVANTILDYAGYGPGALTQSGSGNLILTGANTYTGATNV